MALSTNVTALTREKFIPVLVDNIYNSNILCLKLLKNAEMLDGGKKIVVPVEYANMESGNSGWIAEGGNTVTASVDTYQSATYDWATAFVGVKIPGAEELVNKGSSQVISLLKSKLKSAEKTIRDMFGNAMFDNDGTIASTHITALSGGGTIASGDYTAFDNGVSIIEDLGSDTSVFHFPGNIDGAICGYRRTLGGINSDSNTWWNAKMGSFELASGDVAVGSATGSITWANLVDTTNGVSNIARAMTRMYGACTVDNDQPDLIVTTQAIYDAYETSLQANKRFAGADDIANAGFGGLRFKNATVVVDSHVPDGQMYFLNTNYLDFKVHKERNFAFEDFKRLEGSDNLQSRLFWMGQLVCTNPRMQGVLGGGPSDYS
ncbi:MAG: hypothetical protein CMP21_08795 [Rickettsiales bacterium]|nr:hypothetical protein [Rickettsiales bacterium]|tara:strand:- start:12954 stop:14084 length:1131 start_codon:yes stop_codon:yes gene_type:complete